MPANCESRARAGGFGGFAEEEEERLADSIGAVGFDDGGIAGGGGGAGLPEGEAGADEEAGRNCAGGGERPAGAPKEAAEAVAAFAETGGHAGAGSGGLEIGGEGLKGQVAIGGLFAERFREDRFEVFEEARGGVNLMLAKGSGRLIEDTANAQRGGEPGQRNGWQAGGEFVEQGGEAINVSGWAGGGSGKEFGGGVGAEMGRGPSVWSLALMRLAMPKSMTLGRPFESMRTFEGFRSRWRTSLAWAAARASATSQTRRTRAARGRA